MIFKYTIIFSMILALMFVFLPMLFNHVSPWVAILSSIISLALFAKFIYTKLNQKIK
jgi:hypothetical protein